MAARTEAGLPRRTLLAILAVALIPLLLLGGLAIETLRRTATSASGWSRAALDDQATHALELCAAKTARSIADFLREREGDLRIAALIPRTTAAYLAFSRMRRRSFWRVEDGREVRSPLPLYREIAWIDRTGRERLKVTDGRLARPDELRDVSRPGQALMRSETYFEEARRLARGAIYVGHVTGRYVGRDDLAAGRRFEGIVRFAAPAFDGSGAFDGVIALALDSRHLEEHTAHIVPGRLDLVAQPEWSSGSYAYVIDDRGAVIAHPDDSLQWGVDGRGRPLPVASRKDEIGRLPVLLQHLGFVDENLASIPARAATGRPGALQYEWAGRQKVVAYAAIPYFGGAYRPPLGFGWVGVASELASFHEPASALDAEVRGRVRALTLASVAILLVAGLVVTLTGRAIAGRLQRAWSEARRAEEALAVSERNFRELVGRALIGIYRTTRDGRVIEANPALLSMLGYASVDDLNAVGLIELYVDPADRRRLLAALETGPVSGFETDFRGRDGSLLPVSISAHLVRDEQGGPHTIEGTIENIASRRRAQEELRKAKDAAEEANRAKSHFLANMSHELRTPLNAIIGYSELLAEESEEEGNDQLAADVRRIHSSGQHLLALIDDILDLSKIEAGRIGATVQEFDAAALMRDVVREIEPTLRRNDNRLVVDCPEDLGRLRTDVVKLRRCVGNLLSNAGKFTERGEVLLRARRASHQGEEWLSVTVRDTGIGMTPDQLGLLFRPFTQVDASATRRYGGSGLGLAITRQFCRMLGGDVRVASEPGRGSTFTLEIPVQAHPTAPPAAAGPEA